jgi:hypothetical protein
MCLPPLLFIFSHAASFFAMLDLLLLLLLVFVDYYCSRKPDECPGNASTAIAIGLCAEKLLPVMGLRGIRLIIQIAINTIVPPIPIAYQGIPHIFLQAVRSRMLEQFLLQ